MLVHIRLVRLRTRNRTLLAIGGFRMALDETTLQRQWKITVAICLAYGAVLSVVFGLILYDPTVAGRLVGLTQAQWEGWTITVITRPRERPTRPTPYL